VASTKFTCATALDVTTGCRPSCDAQSGTCTGPTGASGAPGGGGIFNDSGATLALGGTSGTSVNANGDVEHNTPNNIVP
jgi:hypothetical protein